jgi:Kef-type K+ transport system membrane component KefB
MEHIYTLAALWLGLAVPSTVVAYHLWVSIVLVEICVGVALSTTSMAVVYAVMLETGFNKTDFGKGILGACFINDLGTVIALGLLFARLPTRVSFSSR